MPQQPVGVAPAVAALPSGDPAALPLSSRKRSGLGWTSAAASAVLVGASIVLADPQAVVSQLGGVDARWLGPALVIGAAQLLLLGLRWSRIARALGLRLHWLRATSEYALSTLINQLLPTGLAGDGLRVIRHAKVMGEGGLSSSFEALALDRASGQIALWLVVLVSAPLSVRAGLVEVDLVATGAGVLCAGGALVSYGMFRCGRRFPAAARLRAALRRGVVLLLSPRGALVHLPFSLLLVGSMLLQWYVAGRALGVVFSWSQLLWLGPLILVASSVPSFFGGWGIREGASALLFASLGLPESSGVAVSMVYGLFSLLVSLPGVAVLLLDHRR